MKITILGCGNAFSLNNGNNCILLEDETYDTVLHKKKRKLLIDAGWALPFMLQWNSIGKNVSVKDITDVYISHQHSDHIGGLEYLAFSRYDFINKPQKALSTFPTLIANETLMNQCWETSLKGGMSSIEGVDCNLGTFFNLKPIQPNEHFQWCDWDCRLVQQIHIMTGSVITNTFGLIMKKNDKTVYFVTDSQFCSPHQLEVFYKEADIIFQDCELIGVDTVKKEMNFCSHVHANYGQLAGYKNSNSTILPASVKKKMWLTHYQDFVNENADFYGNSCDWDTMVVDEGFAGMVRVGQEFEI